jgi:hypothetical protein
MEEIEFGDFGDESRTFRIEMIITDRSGEGRFDPTPIYLDSVFVAIGNIGMRISASDIEAPYPAGELAFVVELGEDKIRGVVEGSTDGEDNNGDDEPSPTDDEETDEPTEPAGTPPPGSDSSQANPIALGQTGTLLDRAQLRVTDVDFDAEGAVLTFFPDNDPSPPGKNMVLVTVELTNVGQSADLDAFFDLYWNLVGAKGIVYDEFAPSCGITPDELEGTLAPGAALTGNVCVQADEDDSNLVFLVEMFDDNFDSHPLYMALR